MSNRRKIEKFCKDNNLIIESLEYVRHSEHIYGGFYDDSYWSLKIKNLNEPYNEFDCWPEDVDDMLEDIKEVMEG